MSVRAFQLVSSSFGIAIVSRCPAADPSVCWQRLVATEDFGKTWTDITPMQAVPGGLPPGLVLAHPFFLDPEHGWVTANDCAGGKAVLFSTASGGRRWARTPIEASSCHAGAGVVPEFVDPDQGWLVHLEPTGESASIRRTTNGGRTWSRERVFQWITGVRFLDPRDGWLGGFLRDSGGLFRTRDGGRTWTQVALPLPACCQRWTILADRPTFSDADHAVEPVTLRHGNRSVIAFDVTGDAGGTWRLAGVLRLPAGETNGFPAPGLTGIASPTDYWVVAGRSPVMYRTADGARTWRSFAIGVTRSVTSLAVLDGERAWMTGFDGGQRTLFATRDGGRTWRPLAPVASPRRPATSAAIRTVLPLPGPVTALAAGEDGIVYAAFLPQPNGDQQVIVRFDTATGSVVQRSGPIAGGQGGVDRLAYDGGSLWASGGSMSGRGSRTLYQLDGFTLAVRQRLKMPAAPMALAAVPAGLWVAAGTQLELLDPRLGAVRRVSFVGRIRLMVTDPSGRRLYVSTDAPVRNDETPILELDATTGEVIARSWQGYAELNGPSGLAATDDGVWVTAPTGMVAGLHFLRSGDLRQAALFEREGPNSESAYVADGILFVTDPSGGYFCADAATGQVVGYVGITSAPAGISNIVSLPSGLYVGTSDGVARIQPGASCPVG